jgi:hypothetical protein
MRYARFEAKPKFWHSFKKLSPEEKEAAFAAWKIFRQDPFDRRLRTHRIHKLSAAVGQTVYAIEIMADVRAVFFLRGDTVVTLDIGTHDIYKA